MYYIFPFERTFPVQRNFFYYYDNVRPYHRVCYNNVEQKDLSEIFFLPFIRDFSEQKYSLLYALGRPSVEVVEN